MRHLTEGELLDLAEGGQPARSAGHLASCEACRRQLMDLRSAMTAVAAAGDVPEPSPLFWDHLSARVREAVDAESRPESGWLRRWPAWRAVVPIGALAMLALTAALMLRPAHESSTAENAAAGSEIADTAADAGGLAQLTDDPSLTLLADLTADLDWDAASEAGLAPRTDAVDDAVTSLSGGERRELHRLLREALRPPGA